MACSSRSRRRPRCGARDSTRCWPSSSSIATRRPIPSCVRRSPGCARWWRGSCATRVRGTTATCWWQATRSNGVSSLRAVRQGGVAYSSGGSQVDVRHRRGADGAQPQPAGASTSPVTEPKSGCSVRTPATAAPLSGSNATAHTAGTIRGCSLSGNRHNTVRMMGARGDSRFRRRVRPGNHGGPDPAVAAGGQVVGHPGQVHRQRCHRSGLRPGHQYFDSRRAWVSANTSADQSTVGVSPLAK